MCYTTGSTIYQQVISVDDNNMAVSGATFDTVLFQDGAESLLTANVTEVDPARGVFMASFTPIQYGSYQLYMKNNITTTIFVSEVYNVVASGSSAIDIYVGL
jgi:hypothetical protein